MIRIAHTADAHLGYRRYYRAAHGGLNQREVDIALSFRRFMESAVDEHRADVIVIAGDLFHQPRPSNYAVVEAYRQCKRATERGVDVIVIKGNHDTPKSVETGSIFPLLGDLPMVHIATQERKDVSVQGVTFTLMPHLAMRHGGIIRPDHSVDDAAVLVMHGAVPGLSEAGVFEPGEGASPYGSHVAEALTENGQWDYIALGDYHVRTQLAPNAWYSGSLDFCSSNPWREIEEARRWPSPKGWNLVTLDGRGVTVEFVPMTGLREHVDLPAITTDDPALVNERLMDLLPVTVRDKVVRLVVKGIPRLSRREIDQQHVRALKAAALHFNLDLRAPDRRVAEPLDPGHVMEPWEVEQEREAQYWDGRERFEAPIREAWARLELDQPLTIDNITAESAANPDPYQLGDHRRRRSDRE